MNRVGLAGVVLAAVLSAACFVDVKHVSDPGPAFEKARSRATRVAGRGTARQLHVLTYDPDERELTSVSLPLSLLHHVKGDLDFDDDDDVQRKLGRHLRWKDIEEAGPGVLVEVTEDDGEQVLVWLE
jgi:hypothetical protein